MNPCRKQVSENFVAGSTELPEQGSKKQLEQSTSHQQAQNQFGIRTYIQKVN